MTWILQRDVMCGIPSWVALGADAVVLRPIPSGTDHLLALSICCEVMGDLGIDPRSCSWQAISERLPRHHGSPTAKALYADIVNTLRD